MLTLLVVLTSASPVATGLVSIARFKPTAFRRSALSDSLRE
jgi:hypothetical protein